MTNFIVLSKYDISALCNDEPVTVYINKKPYILCGDEFFEKQIRSGMKTQMIDKSDFDERQYRADLDTAYQCGRASVLSVIEDIKAEINNADSDAYIEDEYGHIIDLAISTEKVLSIIDRHISGKENEE